jgi:lysozyme
LVRREAAIFTRILAEHYGRRPILYITADFFDHNRMLHMNAEEFWLRSVAAHPSQRFPGAGWSFWQYSGTGLVPGIAGRVDLNAFNGSAGDWQRWMAARRI